MIKSTEFHGFTVPESWIRNVAIVCSIGMTFATPQTKQASLDLESRIADKPISREIVIKRESPNINCANRLGNN